VSLKSLSGDGRRKKSGKNKKRKVCDDGSVNAEAVRRVAAAALVADCIHRETLVLINMYARDAEERSQVIGHPWNMRVVLRFLYAVTGGQPRKRGHAPADHGDDAEAEEDEEDDAPDVTVKPQTAPPLDAIAVSVQEAFTRLYEPLRRASGLPPLSRKGMPGNALQEIATRIAASINTNIQRHFFRRQVAHIRLRSGCTKAEARAKAQEVNDAAPTAQAVKDDSLPDAIEGSVALTLMSYPERFLAAMWRMNRLREASGVSRFAVLPLATGFVPGGCLHLDTASFVALMTSRHWSPLDRHGKPRHDVTKRMVDALRDARRTKKERIERERQEGRSCRAPGRRVDTAMLNEKAAVWEALFPRLRMLFHSPQRRRFSGHVTTDGVSVSLGLVYPPSGGFAAQPPVRKRGSEPTTSTTPRKKARSKKARSMQADVDEDPVLLALRQRQVIERSVVGCDPGKHVLLHVTNEGTDGRRRQQRTEKGRKTLRYTFAQRREESGAAARQRRLLRRPPPRAILAAQTSLSAFDSRATTLDAFKAYVSTSWTAWRICRAHYEKPHQRIARWQNWRGRRSSEDRFAQRVVDTFGPDAVIAYGSAKGFHALAGLEASPTVGLRRRLEAKRRYLEAVRIGLPTLTIVTTPEYYTSKTCARCDKRSLGPSSEHTRLNRSRVEVSLRGIRRCHNAECGGPDNHRLLWNRDHNAAINIRRNLLHRLEHGTWDPLFSAAAVIEAHNTSREQLLAADRPPAPGRT
jgi:hypothetical protein